MTDKKMTVRIFMMPEEFPCGKDSTCCGSVGQSEEEIETLRTAIEKELGCEVQVINTKSENVTENHPSVAQLMGSFGQKALPVITLDGQVVSMGSPKADEAVSALRGKMSMV